MNIFSKLLSLGRRCSPYIFNEVRKSFIALSPSILCFANSSNNPCFNPFSIANRWERLLDSHFRFELFSMMMILSKSLSYSKIPFLDDVFLVCGSCFSPSSSDEYSMHPGRWLLFVWLFTMSNKVICLLNKVLVCCEHVCKKNNHSSLARERNRTAEKKIVFLMI